MEAIEAESSKYPKASSKHIPYGTAGFRTKAADLTHVMFRCGLVAALRSKHLGGRPVGVMITASHNPGPDNGVKLVEPTGEMLIHQYEEIATRLVNSDNLSTDLQAVAQSLKVDILSTQGVVLVGRDTRESSERLKEAVAAGVTVMRATCADCGLNTTPQLHFLTQQSDVNKTICTDERLYFAHFPGKFLEFLASLPGDVARRQETLYVDCANGVGALKLKELSSCIAPSGLKLVAKNDQTGKDDVLNQGCGAEFAQKDRKVPASFLPGSGVPQMARCAAFDGDADRLVYFQVSPEGHLILFDGDRIAALFCRVIMQLLREAVKDPKGTGEEIELVGVVQTAYANGGSSAYLHSLPGVTVACAKTGVKSLHHKALEFSIGVYFEANGHGTVLYKRSNLETWLKNGGISLESPESKRLFAFLDIFNESTGDAIADLLAVEAALRFLEMNADDWMGLFSELEVAQMKVACPREILNLLKPQPEHEKWLEEPKELQEKVYEAQKAVAEEFGLKETECRAFLRPSGTEDVCRVYAEAPSVSEEEGTQAKAALALAEKLKKAIEEFVASHAKRN